MKSKEGKERWRKFMAECVNLSVQICQRYSFIAYRYEKTIQDHNFGSLIRTDSEGEYSERNTIFGTMLNISAI